MLIQMMTVLVESGILGASAAAWPRVWPAARFSDALYSAVCFVPRRNTPPNALAVPRFAVPPPSLSPSMRRRHKQTCAARRSGRQTSTQGIREPRSGVAVPGRHQCTNLGARGRRQPARRTVPRARLLQPRRRNKCFVGFSAGSKAEQRWVGGAGAARARQHQREALKILHRAFPRLELLFLAPLCENSRCPSTRGASKHYAYPGIPIKYLRIPVYTCIYLHIGGAVF